MSSEGSQRRCPGCRPPASGPRPRAVRRSPSPPAAPRPPGTLPPPPPACRRQSPPAPPPVPPPNPTASPAPASAPPAAPRKSCPGMRPRRTRTKGGAAPPRTRARPPTSHAGRRARRSPRKLERTTSPAASPQRPERRDRPPWRARSWTPRAYAKALSVMGSPRKLNRDCGGCSKAKAASRAKTGPYMPEARTSTPPPPGRSRAPARASCSAAATAVAHATRPPKPAEPCVRSSERKP